MKCTDSPSLWLRWRGVNFGGGCFSRRSVNEAGKPISPIWTDPVGPGIAVWHEHDVFKVPLLRMLYDTQQDDEAIPAVVHLVEEHEKTKPPRPKKMPGALKAVCNRQCSSEEETIPLWTPDSASAQTC